MSKHLETIFTPSKHHGIAVVEGGIVRTAIPGLGEVITHGRGLDWTNASGFQDKAIILEKRDRFDARNALLNSMAEAGSFEYAVAYAPNVNGQRVAKCSLCGAKHNWCVFYRTENGTKHLGWSGTDCFSEIVHNLGLPAADAMVEAVKKERNRCEKFRVTMEKINAFKVDFPGCYEQREHLAAGTNPYNHLWIAVTNRLNAAEGVDEKWLQACKDGAFNYQTLRRGFYDQKNRRYVPSKNVTNTDPERIPDFLKHISVKLSSGISIAEVMAGLRRNHDYETKQAEQAEAAAAQAAQQAQAARAPQVAPTIAGSLNAMAATPATVADYDDDKIQTMAKAMVKSGQFAWSKVIAMAAEGPVASPRAKQFVVESYDAFKRANPALATPV